MPLKSRTAPSVTNLYVNPKERTLANPSKEAGKRVIIIKKVIIHRKVNVLKAKIMMFNNFNNNFIVKNNEHPTLLKLYLGKDISLDTLCLLLEISGAKKHWDSKMQYDFIWDSLRIKVEKYSPFIKYEKDKIKQIIIDYFDE